MSPFASTPWVAGLVSAGARWKRHQPCRARTPVAPPPTPGHVHDATRRATAARKPIRRTARLETTSIGVRPELVVEVKHLTWTDENLLRQAVHKGLREDKLTAEVRRPMPHRKPV